MPDKSRHGKGSHPSKSKRRREKQRYMVTAPQQQVVAQVPKPAVPAGVVAPTASITTPSTAPPVAQYPYITAELQRICIMAGIMLVILIVLALVLS